MPDTERFKLMILEDDQVIRGLIEIAISDVNVEAFYAKTCAEGTQLLKEVRPDLAVLDIGLPDGNGLEFARNMINIYPDRANTPILFLTGRNDEQCRIDSYMVNAIDYIVKPFSVLQFGLKMRNLVNVLPNTQATPTIHDFQDLKISNRHAKLMADLHDACYANCSNQDYSITDVAESLNMSVRTLQRRLKTEHNIKFSDFLFEVRMTKARVMLENYYPQKEVARECGYKYVENFTTAFTRKFHVSPREYQENGNLVNEEVTA